MISYPDNDYRNYLEHGWKKHKYIAIKNGRYVYPKKDDAETNRPRGREKNVSLDSDGNIKQGTVKKGKRLSLIKKLGNILNRPFK